jgi:hypothetical protein
MPPKDGVGWGHGLGWCEGRPRESPQAHGGGPAILHHITASRYPPPPAPRVGGAPAAARRGGRAVRPHTLTATCAATRRCALRRFAATPGALSLRVVTHRRGDRSLGDAPHTPTADGRTGQPRRGVVATPPLRTDAPTEPPVPPSRRTFLGTLGAVAAGAVGATVITPAEAEAQGRAPVRSSTGSGSAPSEGHRPAPAAARHARR